MEKSKETPVTKEVKSLPVFAVFTHCISDFFDFILHIRCDLVHNRIFSNISVEHIDYQYEQ